MLLAAAVAPATGLGQPPPGYRSEREGAVRWTFPASAEPEVQELQRALPQAWATLSNDLGAPLAAELDIRVGLNPTHMQALAPEGRRLPAYASGVAFPEQGVVLLSLTEPRTWLRPPMHELFVHELAHVALARALGGRPAPRWFSEGVAIQASGEHSVARAWTLWEGALRDELLPLAHLTAGFPEGHGEVDLAYAEAADWVGHMLEGKHGRTRFRKMITEVRAGRDFEAAFAIAYNMPLADFDLVWRSHLTRRFGLGPSLLGGLTAVWAAGAVLLVIGYVRVRRKHHRTLKRWAIEEAPLFAAEQQQPPPTPPPPRHVADEVLDAFKDQNRSDPGVPTIVHEGRSYTLH